MSSDDLSHGVYTPRERAHTQCISPSFHGCIYTARTYLRSMRSASSFAWCLYAARTHPCSMHIALFPHGVYTPFITTRTQWVPLSFPHGVYTPWVPTYVQEITLTSPSGVYIGHGLRRKFRQRHGKRSVLGYIHRKPSLFATFPQSPPTARIQRPIDNRHI